MTPEAITDEITRRCWRFGVSVLIVPDTLVDLDGRKVGGYFDPEARKLVAGNGSPRALGTILHEYCHVTQWAEDCVAWRACIKAQETADLDDWLAGKPQRGIKALIETTREMEADNERRTLRLIRELDAPLDPIQYAQGANSYIHFHNVMLATRKWYRPDRQPYFTPEVVALFNTTIDHDFSRTPANLRAALETCV